MLSPDRKAPGPAAMRRHPAVSEEAARETGHSGALEVLQARYAQRSRTSPRLRIPEALGYLLNAAPALVLILLGLPLFAGIAVVILLVDGRPVLYRGARLGRHRRPYTMYKFRTLVRGASRELGADLVSHRHRATIPCGRFLRDTRLDELPQLFNILKGDMSFVGPRPERPEVYENVCRHLSGYDRRFSVKPGLVGYSQLFTPHGTPKRLRNVTDRLALPRLCHPFWDTIGVLRTIGAVGMSVAGRGLRFLRDDVLLTRVLRRHPNRRESTRIRPRNAEVLIERNGDRPVRVAVEDMNETALLLRSPEKVVGNGAPLSLRIEVRFRRRLRPSGRRFRVARCTGRITQTRSEGGNWLHVLQYESATEWNQYIIDQYLLRSSLASPFW